MTEISDIILNLVVPAKACNTLQNVKDFEKYTIEPQAIIHEGLNQKDWEKGKSYLISLAKRSAFTNSLDFFKTSYGREDLQKYSKNIVELMDSGLDFEVTARPYNFTSEKMNQIKDYSQGNFD